MHTDIEKKSFVKGEKLQQTFSLILFLLLTASFAQNVEEVLPSAVSDTEDLNGEDSHKVVDYNQLSALFIEAIKELKEENSQLKAAIEELKNINNTK